MLKKYRDEIDIIDKQILDLYIKRFKVVEKIGEFKKDKKIDALQPGRWQEVLNSKIKIGTRKGLSEEFIKDIWNRVHEEALKIEK